MTTLPSDNNEARIIIHRLIVHKIDHKQYDQPVLADLETTMSDEIASFIRRHITRNRGHKNASTARYKNIPNGVNDTVHALGDGILGDESLFIANTRRVAELLFSAQKKKNASAGELVICIFSELANTEERWIALMKMDPEDGFVGKEERVGDQIRIVLEKVEDVYPTGELQKCAFILPIGLRDGAECDLVVLDQLGQTSGGNRQVASYFLEDFLCAERDLNSRELTRGFVKHVGIWGDEKVLSGEWSADRAKQVRQAAIDAVQSRRKLDIPAFASEHLDEPEEEDRFVEMLSTELSKAGRVTNLVFQPDLDQRLIRYRRFKGDFGLKVRIKAGENIPSDFINDEIDPATGMHIITIKTATWQEE